MSVARREIFLSYGREPEVISFVTQLKHDLEHHGFSIWLDSEDIPAGCDWHGAIGTGLDQCKALIAVVTRKYITSRYCTSELYTADSDQKLIFPVIFEDVDFSATEKSRGVKYVISGINWTMFRPGVDEYHNALAKLIQGMKEHGLVPGSGTAHDEVDVGLVSGKMSQLHLSPSSQAPNSDSPGPYGLRPPSPTPHPTAPPITTHTSPYNAYAPHSTPPHPHTSPGYPPGSPYQYQYPSQYSSPPHMQAHGYYPPNPNYPMPYVPGATPPRPSYNTPPHPSYPTPPHPSYPTPPHPSYPTPPHPSYPTPPHPSYPTAPHPAYPTTPSAVPPQVQGVGYGPQPPPDYSELYPGGAGQATTPGPPPATTTKPPPPPRPSFKVGMKLEAVDRRFPYFVCVATIMDRTDNTVMIHFDGWGPGYNYWCPSDSVELHPAGWCKKHGWALQAPHGQQDEWTTWKNYLSKTDAESADESLFNEGQIAAPGSLLFKPNMRLEAKDLQNPQHPNTIAVATISDIRDGKLLIHFDGWSTQYDYWCKADSTDIHPAMWSGKNQKDRVLPPKGQTTLLFKWSEYLADPSINPAPAHLFTEEQRAASSSTSGVTLGGFKVGMKLEAKDRLNPSLVCVATISDIKDGRLLIHFDGWGMQYDYWCRPDSKDIHPRGWCRSHGKELQAPGGGSAATFNWDLYLQSGVQAAPNSAFTGKQK